MTRAYRSHAEDRLPSIRLWKEETRKVGDEICAIVQNLETHRDGISNGAAKFNPEAAPAQLSFL